MLRALYTGASFVRLVVHAHIQPWNSTSLHQWVLLVTGDFLGFTMCSSSFTILPTQDNAPHPTALPQASMSCPVPSLFAKLLPQLPTY